MPNLREQLIAIYNDFAAKNEAERLDRKIREREYQKKSLISEMQKVLRVEIDDVDFENDYAIQATCTVDELTFRSSRNGLNVLLTCPNCLEKVWSDECQYASGVARVVVEQDLGHKHRCPTPELDKPVQPTPEPQTWQEKLAEALVEALQEANHA